MYKKILVPALFLILLTYPVHLFSQSRRVDGYRGIWFSEDSARGSGYKFSGGVATFATRHRPVSIYSPEAGKTFFVYGGTTTAEERHLLIMVSYFDHRLKGSQNLLLYMTKWESGNLMTMLHFQSMPAVIYGFL